MKGDVKPDFALYYANFWEGHCLPLQFLAGFWRIWRNYLVLGGRVGDGNDGRGRLRMGWWMPREAAAARKTARKA